MPGLKTEVSEKAADVPEGCPRYMRFNSCSEGLLGESKRMYALKAISKQVPRLTGTYV